ncbi:YkgJ family cysteine cluster protein [Pseudodesulfovibrio sp. zrk46]|uniref:YkgJ family cysteine cluster protein n=1 Tax=Pseudodesulfovibrio sp. zrk46 TaxID=2725288 RepID=UPI00144925C2|nr:YkgJ family cysteine cluster protein [Pseudodesulfovibrio sp. zrk46]QJB58301.1 YkgJ family cysteine cluster protein [Pseudodesulfovibrio sp. zrk46]
MAIDFTEYFEKYEAIVAEVDAVFTKFETEMGDLVKCGKGCSDCCHALFDITLAEAIYINHKFNENFSGLERSQVLERADKADRQIHKLKRKVYKATQEGRPANEILNEVARARVRCPMLGDDNLCAMYEFRPITCRLYGVPTSIGGEAHTCSLAGFKGGEKYPTVNMDIIIDRLINIGKDVQKGVDSRFKELGNMLLPLSMALVTEYDEHYLGVKGVEAPKPKKAAQTGTTFTGSKPTPQEIVAPGAAPKDDACSSCTEDKSSCSSCDIKTVVLGGE